MIISRTPLRVSFAGGGTDMEDFYKEDGGAVTSTAINRYMYITVNKKFDSAIRVSYSSTENVEHVDHIKHPIVREALKLTGITKGIEITSMADVPAKTGMGSSSSYAVGLLNALYAYKGEFKSPDFLAEQACKIEIELCKEPIGKQDQYIAAFGGVQHIQFNKDGSVFVDPVICSAETKKALEEGTMLFYTGVTRPASTILTEQKKNIVDKMEILKKMKAQAEMVKDALIQGDLNKFGSLLNEGWQLKRQLAGGITSTDIDKHYDEAIKAGAIGGKLLGAGGGGFLMFFCPPEKQDDVRRALTGLKETTLALEPQGSKIIYVSD
jgi:D-glycero-alpha-D-manno-heptose-7-phosphate kinase